MKNLRSLTLVTISLAISSLHLPAAPAGSAFSYQGRLTTGTNPANGSYDLKFSLFDSISAGTQIGTSRTNSSVSISNGTFTTSLDFGSSAFDGTARWLEIGVRTNGPNAFSTLTPRQPLTPTPYSISASNLTGVLPASQLTGTLPAALLSGTYTGAVTFNNAADSFTGNGAGLAGVNAVTLNGYSYCALPCYWKLTGNSGTTLGVNFLGTIDDQGLELRVFNKGALRLEPSGGTPNLIGGFSGNSALGGSQAATIAGGGGLAGANSIYGGQGETIGGGIGNSINNSFNGGSSATIGGGLNNYINDWYGLACTISGGSGNKTAGGATPGIGQTIGGGESNTVYAPNLGHATIGGGLNNTANGPGSTIGGGILNYIFGDDTSAPQAHYSTIAGGYTNLIGLGAVASTIAGGDANLIEMGFPVLANHSTISGGESNAVRSGYGVIGGGLANMITNGDYATVSGGDSNQISAPYSAIGGGIGNAIRVAGDHSTVAGGASNAVSAAYGSIGGGSANSLNAGSGLTIAGGQGNLIDGANGAACTIGGGAGNIILSHEALGYSSTIAGGSGNNIFGWGGPTISGGESNNIHAPSFFGVSHAVIGGGFANQSGGAGSTIGGGALNAIFGDDTAAPQSRFATIGGGYSNQIVMGAIGATIGGGYANYIHRSASPFADRGTISGGESNLVSAAYGTIPGGAKAVARNYGQQAYATGQFATNGDAQTSVYVCRNLTTNATQSELFLDGLGARMIVPTNSTWAFDILVTGRAANGTSGSYQLLGEIKNNGGTVSFGSTVKQTILAEDNASWDATAVPDSTAQALEVKVTGTASTSIRWVATVRTVEVGFY